MKKSVAVILGGLMMISLVACSSSNPSGSSTSGETEEAIVTENVETEAEMVEDDDGDQWSWDRRIEVMIPASEGGGLDTSMRKFAPYLEEVLGTNVSIVNKSGTTGVTGYIYSYNSTNDGYAFQYTAPTAIIAAAQGLFEFDLMEEIIPVSGLMSSEGMIFGRTDAPWTTAEEMIEYAKDHPGEITMAVDSPNGIAGAIITELQNEAGIEFNWITSESSESYISVISGDIDLCINTWQDAGAYAESGDLDAVLVLADERNDCYPNVTCSGELGYDITQNYYRVFTAMKGTPEAAVVAFAEAIKTASQNPEWVEWLENNGCTNDYVWDAEELAAVLDETYRLAIDLNE